MYLRSTPVYREKKYVCGNYLDVYIYPVYRRPGPRGKRTQRATEAQRALNGRHASEKLARLLHSNFTDRDVMLTLTYFQNPADDAAAKRDIRNFIRRLKHLRKRTGLEALKYVYVTEKSSTGRYHFHLVISGGLDRDRIERLWPLGYANSRRLRFGKNGIAGLARYMVKAPVFSRRWCGSKNLTDPQPEICDSRIRSRKRAKELAEDRDALWAQIYGGYALAELSAFHTDETSGIYLFARMYRDCMKYSGTEGSYAQEQNRYRLRI